VSALEKAQGIDCRREADRWGECESLFVLIEKWVAHREYAEVAARLTQYEILWGPYQTFNQLLAEDPRCSTANPMFAQINQPGIGSHLAPGSAVAFGDTQRVPVHPAPALGDDTDEVLGRVLHLSETDLKSLRAAGTLPAASRGPG
jgi:2-methylfumaryl-CoA isomerase